MSDSNFNIVTSLMFLMAVLFNGFVVYKIAFNKPMVKQRTIIIDNRCKTPAQGISLRDFATPDTVCTLDEDDWKEIKAETL